MKTDKPAPGRRIPPILSLSLVLLSGIYTAASERFSILGIIIFAVSAIILFLLCRKPAKKASAAEGIIAVGSVVYALPSGIIVASPTFGGGLMAVGVGIAVLHIV